MKKHIKGSMRRIADLLFPMPRHLLSNQIQIDEHGLRAVAKSIKENYHTGWRSESNYTKEVYEQDRDAHLIRIAAARWKSPAGVASRRCTVNRT